MDSLASPALLSPAHDAPAGEASWTCRITPKGSGRYVLHLSGSLHAGWAGRLAAGLAAHRITVLRAAARRTSTRWTAEIHFAAVDARVEPSAIDFLALLREPIHPARAGGKPALDAAQVVRTRRDALVEVRARDAVGFLGRILLVFAELGLFPHEMRVETLAGEVRDLFRLQTAAGEAPAEGVVAALRARLAALVVER